MLNIHGSDVVREKHHFIAVQFRPIFVRKRESTNLAHDSHDKIAGTDKGVDDVDAGIGERAIEFGAEDVDQRFSP